MKKLTQITIAILFITGLFFSSCEKDSEPATAATTSLLVGKWFTKKYVEIYYNPSGVKAGQSSSTDFNNTDFIDFKANGDYENFSGLSKYTYVGDKVTVTGKVNRAYTVKVLTTTDLELFYTTTDNQNYKYEVTLTLKK